MFRNITNQDISWFLDLKEKGQLDLDPPYQRRSVWSTSDRKFFIDTVLNNYPAPPVFLHKELDDNGRQIFHVVDGKQRLQTIIDFANGEIRIPDDFHDNSLQKKYWNDLDRDTQKKFWNYTLIVEMLPDTANLAIKDIFDRLNRNARTLNKQEMRHAKYDGWFINFVEQEAQETEWEEFGVVTAARARRMSDVQFLSELCAIVLEKKLHGFDQRYLDKIYAEYEDIDEIGTFSLENFSDEISRIKSIITDLIKKDPDIINYLKIKNHFYSLWGYLHLEQSNCPNNTNIAKKYKKFMDSAMEIVHSGKTLSSSSTGSKRKSLPKAKQAEQNYASGSQGASTDLAQREMRHSGLVSAIN